MASRVWERELEGRPNKKRDDHAVGGGLAIAGDKLIVTSGFAYIEALSLADGSRGLASPRR